MADAAAVAPATQSRAGRLALVLLAGAAVAIALGVYAKVHTPAGRPVFTLGFSGMLQMKTWLATAALAFVVVQLVTALAMWGRLPGVRGTAQWLPHVHRYSGAIGFVLSLGPGFHCLWSLGFGTGSTRVLAHSVAGCAFYGAYAAKMLGLRVRGLPGRTIPILGGLVLTAFAVTWASAALWFFSRSSLPLT